MAFTKQHSLNHQTKKNTLLNAPSSIN